MLYLWIVLAVVVVLAVVLTIALVRPRGRGRTLAPPVPREPAVGDDAAVPRDTPTRSVGQVVDLPPDGAALDLLERPEPTAGRLIRLRSRLARSQSGLGRGLLTVLSRDRLDDEAWEEIEEALLTSDVGVAATTADRRCAARTHPGAGHAVAG